MELEALIFDVDGTMALTEEAHREAFNRAFTEFGYDFAWDRALYGRLLQVAGGRERITAYFRDSQPQLLKQDGAELVAQLHKRKTAIFQDMLRTGAVPLRPGVARLIAAAERAKVKLAVATTTHRGNLDLLLASNMGPAVMDRFAAVCTGGEVERKKPAPDLYLLALERLGLPGAACLAIEDTQIGLQSARAAEIPVVITPSDYSRDEDFTGAVAVVDSLGDPESGGPVVGFTELRVWHAAARNSESTY